MTNPFTEFEFNYASFSLTPYSGNDGTSTQLLKSIIYKLNEADFPSEKRIIDRHENRTNTVSRKLVLISNIWGEKGLRCFGRIALIKNKVPMIWAGKDIIEEIQKESSKQFIEVTNYAIHFNPDADPVIMYEFNSEGPRLSDIEFYIRQIAKDFKLAKLIKASIHLKISYEELDKELKNVYGITVKVNSANNNRFDWLQALKNINDSAGYRDVRLELFYNRQKDLGGKSIKNIRGLDFARGIIGWLKEDVDNTKYLDDLKMEYEDSHENIIDLDFLKNKEVSLLKIPLTDGKTFKLADFRSVVGQEFNHYLTKGVTTSDEK